MSQQQRRFSGGLGRKMKLYREFMLGPHSSRFSLFSYELYQILCSDVQGAIGLGLRGAFLPCFLKAGGRSLALGRGVTIRQPGAVTLGSNVIIEEFATLDIRSIKDENGFFNGSITLGDNVLIGRNSILVAKGGSISLGQAVNVSSFCRIATETQITVEDSVLIAAYSYIGPGNHLPIAADSAVMEGKMDHRGGVTIKKGAWIGAHSTVLDGVTVGEGAIVGAHSLVREDVPDFAIVAGIPAKIVRMRGES